MAGTIRMFSTRSATSNGFRIARSALAFLLLLTGHAAAQPVNVTTNTALTSTDVLFPGTAVPVATAQVTVQNATLTISGNVSIASLTVASGGVVTHPVGFTFADPGMGGQTVGGFRLSVDGDVSVSTTGLGRVWRIICSARVRHEIVDRRGWRGLREDGTIAASGKEAAS